MQFYKIDGVIEKKENDPDSQELRQKVEELDGITSNFNLGYDKKSYYFISHINRAEATLGVITDSKEKLDDGVRAFLNAAGISLVNIKIQEVTIRSIYRLLTAAYRKDYIEDCDEIKSSFGLDAVLDGHPGPNQDTVLREISKEDIYKILGREVFSESLNAELNRIYASKAPECFGHPVHYLVRSDDGQCIDKIYSALLTALYENGRIKSRRFTGLSYNSMSNFSDFALDGLFRLSEGGAVVISYASRMENGDDDTDDDARASAELEIIERICRAVKKHRNKVLTILCLKLESTRLKKMFFEELGTMTFVELAEELADCEKSREFLAQLAEKEHVEPDARLMSRAEPGKTYLVSELRKIFDEWYNFKLKTDVYPQYRELSAISPDDFKSAPKGSAYDELASMTGLAEAKDVINKALNYYKMQKLFKDRGVKVGKPAMHMVFSGNPGTAKTTAARLFSRIMRENEILSKGHLVEVGRGDLVGKYVGWTAQTVKQRFKQAEGGVLFIDEAYALVDDRDGSYGDEAINTIVQEMENHRDELVVIFAGYPDKMEEFLNKNPGLRSRIAFHVPFADYSSSELCSIAEHIGRGMGVTLSDGALRRLGDAFEIARSKPDFGNGRYVRTLLEQSRMAMADRVLKKNYEDISDEDITTITEEDIVLPEAEKKQTRRTIGFAL